MNERSFVSTDDLGKAAYAGCFMQYGHPQTRDLNEAWEWIGEDQRKMWRAVADSVMARLIASQAKAA